MDNKKANSVLVVGGGIAGIKASLDLAEAGRKVYIIDSSPSLGGYLPLLDRQFPTNDCQICFLSPELAKTGYELDIEVLPLTRINSLEGQKGEFTASITTQPRYIDVDKCTACGDCVDAAPGGAVSFTPGLDHRSPTCMRYPTATPQAFAIDKEKLNGESEWTKVCAADAIDLEQKAVTREVEVGSVILSTGAELFDPSKLDQLSYTRFPDVVTSLEFERIMSAAGPTGGRFARPSDGKEPKRIGWVQCVGSRSVVEPAKPYCSSICCMFAMKEAAWAKEHFADDLDATVFYMDMRPMGKDYEQYYQRVKNELDVNFIRCRPHTVTRDNETGELLLEYLDPEGQPQQARLDMLVLATGFVAPCDARATADVLGIDLDAYNFVATEDFAPVATSKPGVYACGMSLGPRDIPDSIMQASAAAALASEDLDAPAGISREEQYPPEKDLRGEEAKVGVFLSDFGGTVRNVIDFGLVIDALGKQSGVDHVEELEYLWTADGIAKMQAVIEEKGLNRVVVAGCSLRAHGPIFADAVRKTGLNKAFLELTNIREQDAWVHGNDPAVATTKAIDLIRMSVAHVRAAQPIYPYRQEIGHTAMVVGGGVAGMSAALSLANQGVKVHLIERGKELGGMAMKLKRSLDGSPVAPKVQAMIEAVKGHDQIEVISEAFVVDHSGELGSFKTGVQSGPGLYYQEIEHGVTILATGAKAYEPTEYLYGQDPRILTQYQLEELLAKGDGSDDTLDTVVMIQCVGSRNEKNPSCGRICCRSAVKNINWIKEFKPEAQVIVLYRDMRMPYTGEDDYRRAREDGVLFVRYEPENPPQVTKDGDELSVGFTDPILGQQLVVNPSALVLSVPQVAVDEDTEELASIFRLQRNDTGFLLEDNIKWKPVDSPVPGLFMAGSVLAPKSINEAVTQGLASAGRALTVLAQHSKTKDTPVAKVIPEYCAACLVCVRACPFDVPFINADGYSEIDPSLCQGCGICVAECPAKAIQLQGYSDDQIMGATDALLEGVL